LLGIVFLGSILWLVLGACNVWLLLRRLEAVPFARFLRAYLESWLLSLLFPGQLGDASQMILLRQVGVPVHKSGAAYVLDKAVSFVWLGAVSVVGIALYSRFPAETWVLSIVIGGFLVVVAAWIVTRGLARTKGWASRLSSVWFSIVRQILGFRNNQRSVVLNFGMTVLKWAVNTALYVVAFRAISIPIGIGPAATLPFVSSLVGYVPVTVAGAGTMELTAIVLFGRQGIAAASVLSVYLLMRMSMVLGAVVTVAVLDFAAPAEGRR
jgi:uncharacterized membrane protein YbhN (UPF0104 family)